MRPSIHFYFLGWNGCIMCNTTVPGERYLGKPPDGIPVHVWIWHRTSANNYFCLIWSRSLHSSPAQIQHGNRGPGEDFHKSISPTLVPCQLWSNPSTSHCLCCLTWSHLALLNHYQCSSVREAPGIELARVECHCSPLFPVNFHMPLSYLTTCGAWE